MSRTPDVSRPVPARWAAHQARVRKVSAPVHRGVTRWVRPDRSAPDHPVGAEPWISGPGWPRR
ncbi:hypothetical protein GCM10009818_19510 [Nakamurella flavida]